MPDRPLTAAELRVLRAAARGDLYRSESGFSLYDSFIRGERRKVNATVDRLTSRTDRLLSIGEQQGTSRPWHLTDAGRAELAKHPEES